MADTTPSSEASPFMKGVLDLDALTPPARTFVQAILEKEDLPERLAKMALVFRRQGQNPMPVYWPLPLSVLRPRTIGSAS